MANYTVTLDTEQDNALSTLIDRVNVERANKSPPMAAINKSEYIQDRASEIADSYKGQLEAEDEKGIISAYKNADAATKASIKTTLGV